nr:hypothetical protein [Segatella maculosa]
MFTYLLVNCQSNCERTHGPCVPTCSQTNRAISHVTRQYGHDSGVGSTVRASAHGEMKRKYDGYRSGRTDRASLHALKQIVLSAMLRVNMAMTAV